jgi:hypothetical protein
MGEQNIESSDESNDQSDNNLENKPNIKSDNNAAGKDQEQAHSQENADSKLQGFIAENRFLETSKPF